MKIIIDDYNKQDIEIHEYLEPQGAFYSIIQGDNKIDFDNEYQVKEFIDAFKFLAINRYAKKS